MDEVIRLFPGKYIHIGGDECPKDNWKRSAFCQQLIKEKGLKDVLLTGGGIIPEEDNLQLQNMGIGHLFAPGTNTTDIATYIKTWVAANRKS